MAGDPQNVLFLCTGNSARSILAEVLLNELGQGRYRAYSAGSHPAGRVNPGAIEVLERHGHPVDGLASKSWDSFSGKAAPQVDIVITVCDTAAGESCPLRHGDPVTAHWGIPDPAAVNGEESRIRDAFEAAYASLRSRIEAMLTLEIGVGPGRHDLRLALQGIHDAAVSGEADHA